jgi:hypothetical protein
MAKPWADAGYQCFCFDGQHPLGVSQSDHKNILNVGMWFSKNSYGEFLAEDVDKILSIAGEGVEFVFGFPECTDLAVSGAVHFASKREKNPQFQEEAMMLFYLTEKLSNEIGCKWGLENPVSVASTLWRKPDFKFHPYEYGGYLPANDIHPYYPEYIKPRDAYPKKTCIWSGGGFVIPEFIKVGPDGFNLVDGKSERKNEWITRFTCRFVESSGRRVDEEVTTLKYPEYDIDGLPIWGYSDQHKKLGGKSLKTKNIRSATPRGFAQAVFEANSDSQDNREVQPELF